MGLDRLNFRINPLRLIALLVVIFACAASSFAQSQTQTSPESDVASETRFAPVVIDGNELFRVSALAAISGTERAEAISARIKSIAADRANQPEALHTSDAEYGTAIFVGSQRLMIVFDADAKDGSVPRQVLAELYKGRIQNAIVEYRAARTRQSLTRGAGRSALALLVLILSVIVIIWVLRRLYSLLERKYRERTRAVGIQSFQVVRAEQIWRGLQRVIGFTRVLAVLVLCFFFLQFVLRQFPWTRATGQRLRGYLLSPLETMGLGILNHIPSIIFLVILYFVARAVLRVIHKFFDAIGTGDVKLASFDPEWAESTYKLIRLAIVVLALVVAYPYIPGGQSDAFKGITIFIGLVFSLGSSSAIANLIAGYMMTYRRAFRVGDRIKIGDLMGDVTEMRLQVTHLKTVKNEEVIIPNSSILNNEVVNYSSLARTKGLILYSRVNIGYGTPWRQVEALLLMAAERTPDIMKEPPPFVLQKSLGDFAVTYEINVYCATPQAMGRIYTGLHRNILDLFNEYGVQIMTPAYETDPNAPKLVAKENWFSAPAEIEQGAR